MAGVSRRDLDNLRRALGDRAKAGCPDCWGVHYIGAPGLFVVAYRKKRIVPPQGAKAEKLTDEEFERYFHGCPTCGAEAKTYPIVMQGISPKREVPDPWPVNEWPPIRVRKPRYEQHREWREGEEHV